MNTATEHHDGPHVSPLYVYFGVYGALMFLTVVTVGVSLLDLGPAAIGVAMIIAAIKGSLVVAYFMHLRYDGGFLNVIFFSALFFMALFFSFVMMDLGSRDLLVPEHGNNFLRTEKHMVIDAPLELTKEGHDMPAAYINKEKAAEHSQGNEGHEGANPCSGKHDGGH